MAQRTARKKNDNKRVMVIGAIGVVLVAGLGVYSLSSGGGSSSKAPTGTTAAVGPAAGGVDTGAGAQPAAATAPTTTTAAPGQPVLPSGSFDVFATKDPFQPAIVVGPPVTGTPGTGTTTATTAPPTGTTGSTGGTGSTAATAPPAGGTTVTTAAPSQNPSAGTSVAVLDVTPNAGAVQVSVQVGSTVYTVTPGQTFAVNYKLVSVSGTCGQFQYGDSPFQLCKGEQVIK